MTLFADTAGERLDAFLARQPGNLSRSAAQRLIEEGMVTRNGGPEIAGGGLREAQRQAGKEK